ncbi:S8 family serine peptidase [bacterium]|nr:S8 family serine peptidase [bacterium]
MKKYLTALVLMATFCFGYADKFIPGVFEKNNIMVCFKLSSIGNIDGIIKFTTENKLVKTNILSFNEIANDYEISNITQDCPDVKHKDWNDNGSYIQAIYKITLKDHSRIEQALNALRRIDDIIWADYVTINKSKYLPNDTLYEYLWYIPQTDTDKVWDFVRDASDVVIAITDSGIKWNHPDLKNNIWLNEGEMNGVTINWDNGTFTGDGVDNDGNGKVDDVMGWDFVGNDNNPHQNWNYNYHGTHVAGCASAVGDNNLGTVGPAFNAKLLNCKGAPDNQDADGVSSGYQQIVYAADMGADIINASWGGQTYNLSYANTYVNYATNYGSLVVVAAGNGNVEHNSSYIDAPSDCPNAFNVAATDRNDTKASFSEYGEPIDISAPGTEIRSAIIENNRYDNAQGTSMASPIVCGIAALVKAVNPNFNPAQLRARIENTADFIDDLNPNYAGKLGAGRINAFTAVLYDKIPNIRIIDKQINELSGDGDGVPNPGETVSLTVNVTNYLDLSSGLNWATSTNTEIYLRCNHPGVVIHDSLAYFGNIIAGETIGNTSSPFTMTTSSDMTTQSIEFILHIEANLDSEYPYIIDIPFESNLSLDYPDWSFPLTGQSLSSPIIIDINNDDSNEIVFGDLEGNINAITNTQSQVPGFPVSVNGQITLPLAIGDLNNDGIEDIVAVTSTKEAYAISGNGSLLWGPISLDNQLVKANPIVTDVNGDGNKEAIICTMNGKLHIIDGNGNEFPNYPVEFPGSFVFNLATGDLNMNGHQEIIMQSISGNIFAIDYQTQDNISGFPYSLGSNTEFAPLVTNVDSDEYPEIISAISSQGVIKIINYDGTTAYEFNIGEPIKQDILFADFDNNGSQELLFTTYNGSVHALSLSGSELPNFPLEIGSYIEGYPLLSNLDGEGLCLIFGDTSGKLHAINHLGLEAGNFPINLNDNLKVSPALGDIDNDGDLDLVISTITQMRLFDLKRNGYSNWVMHRGNPGRTANSYEATTPIDESIIQETPNSLLNNYPNPFNPETTISFSIKEDSHVQLEIFNIKGQKVKTLINSHLPSGNHRITWDGRDNNNNNVTSGIYLYRMKNGKFTKSKKMILLK